MHGTSEGPAGASDVWPFDNTPEDKRIRVAQRLAKREQQEAEEKWTPRPDLEAIIGKHTRKQCLEIFSVLATSPALANAPENARKALRALVVVKLRAKFPHLTEEQAERLAVLPGWPFRLPAISDEHASPELKRLRAEHQAAVEAWRKWYRPAPALRAIVGERTPDEYQEIAVTLSLLESWRRSPFSQDTIQQQIDDAKRDLLRIAPDLNQDQLQQLLAASAQELRANNRDC